MRELDLPITRKFATGTVDRHEVTKNLASGKNVSFGTFHFGKNGKEINEARVNGGKVIWSATCIEEKLDSLIIRFVFASEGKQNEKGMQFFKSRIVKSNLLSYENKKNLVVDIVNSESLLKGKEKNELGKNLKDVMHYRNAFAHGEVIFEVDKGCVLDYWRGRPQQDELNEEYWNKLENIFKKADQLVDKAFSKL